MKHIGGVDGAGTSTWNLERSDSGYSSCKRLELVRVEYFCPLFATFFHDTAGLVEAMNWIEFQFSAVWIFTKETHSVFSGEVALISVQVKQTLVNYVI